MNQTDVFNLGLIGVLLLAVPAIIAGVFPLVEKTVSLLSETLFLRSFKGKVMWVIIFAAIMYVSGNILVVRFFQELP